MRYQLNVEQVANQISPELQSHFKGFMDSQHMVRVFARRVIACMGSPKFSMPNGMIVVDFTISVEERDTLADAILNSEATAFGGVNKTMRDLTFASETYTKQQAVLAVADIVIASFTVEG